MKKTSLATLASLIFLATILVVLGSWLWHNQKTFRQPAGQTNTSENQAIDYTSHTLQDLADVAAPEPSGHEQIVAGITSHHLPVAEHFIGQFYAQLRAEQPDVSEFVVIGPDHFEHCKNLASVATRDFLSPFGPVPNDRGITSVLLDAGAGEDNSCFEQEHAVGVEITFIKKYFPNARVAAVLFSSAAPVGLPAQLASALNKYAPNAVVIESTDFSHYESLDAANRIDERTERQIRGMDVSSLQLEQVDSPAALRFAVAYAMLHKAAPNFLVHANSYDFTGQRENTTSYFNVLFEY